MVYDTWMPDEFQGEPVIEHDSAWARSVLDEWLTLGVDPHAVVDILMSPLAPAPWHHATLTVVLHADHTWSYE